MSNLPTSVKKRRKLKEITKEELLKKNSPLFSKNEDRENCTFEPKINSEFVLRRLNELQKQQQEDKRSLEEIMSSHYSPYKRRNYSPTKYSRKSRSKSPRSLYSKTPERKYEDLEDWMENKVIRPYQRKLKRLGI